MTSLQIMRAKALAQCTFLPGHEHKRFAKHMAALAEENDGKPLSPARQEHLARLCWRYRRQMPAELVPAQDPDTLGARNVTEGLDHDDTATEDA